MDAISYAHSAKQEQRIKKFINDPDSTSGVLTVPKVIASGESVTIPAGRVAVLPNVQIDGTLNVQGDVFIPSGATLSGVVEKVTSTDNAVVRFDGTIGKVQNSGVIIDDSNNVNLPFDSNVQITGNKYAFYDKNGAKPNSYGALEYKSDWYGDSPYFKLIVNNTEKMRIDSAGSLNVGVSGSAFHNFRKNVTLNAGNPIFEIAESGSGNGWSAFIAYGVGAFGANASNCAVRIGKDANTNRSINAGGTINASGADYAEYEYSNDITLVKGQIVGFKEDGTLTDKYSEAIRFAIKSTNPSIVGGDTWGIEEIVGKKPLEPIKTEETTDEEFAKLEEQYKVDLVDFENRLEAERQKVDRIAYAGKVPVNVYGAKAGQYVIAIEKEDGTIDGKLVNKADITFAEYQDAVGRVNKILDDGRAEVAVIIH